VVAYFAARCANSSALRLTRWRSGRGDRRGDLSRLLITGVLAVAVAFIGAELRVRWLRLLLFFAMAAAMVTNWGSPRIS